MKREDNFQVRRQHLANLSDEQLRDRFWQLTEQVVDPLLKMGHDNTTPSIERSVLLRMGFSSIEVKEIVDAALERSLLGHGAGNIVFKLAKEKGLDIRETGLALAEGKYWDEAAGLFQGVDL